MGSVWSGGGRRRGEVTVDRNQLSENATQADETTRRMRALTSYDYRKDSKLIGQSKRKNQSTHSEGG